jgi:hypothetical protein
MRFGPGQEDVIRPADKSFLCSAEIGLIYGYLADAFSSSKFKNSFKNLSFGNHFAKKWKKRYKQMV